MTTEPMAADANIDTDALTEKLTKDGVDTVAVAIVDPSGVTRVKAIPAYKLPTAMQSGIGFPQAISIFCVYDLPAQISGWDAPIGDLRLIPDLESYAPLVMQPGVAWVAADQYDQRGQPWPACPRLFLQRSLAQLQDQGLELRVGYEFEWFQGERVTGEDPVPAHPGPGYSAIAFTHSDAPRTLLTALYRQKIPVEQFHAELAPGQFELSTGPLAPLLAADTNLLVRQTIRGAAKSLGQEASFSPVTVVGGIGNGAHLHFSLLDDSGRNLLIGSEDGPGMAPQGAAFAAGVLRELPALTAITSPSPLSYLRLQPRRWAGAYQAWGPENRETALRYITGMTGQHNATANFEYKAVDHAANPYLALGAIIAAGLEGLRAGLTLPPPVTVDPSTLSEDQRLNAGIARLPGSLSEAADKLERSDVLRGALGETLMTSFLATRRAEADMYRRSSEEELVDALRWRY